MSPSRFTVAIVGRPNVGKSTLFNRLVGKRLAIVDDTPGVTRDRREGEGRLGDLTFRVIDTAGLDDVRGEALEARMRTQTERAIAEADAALLLIDARAGVTPLDAHFAAEIRKGSAPVFIVANKCEGRAGLPGLMDAFALGLGEPIALSAEHGEGLAELYDVLAPLVDAATAATNDLMPDTMNAETDETASKPVQLAVVGRPNVGKSTLVNRLLGEDRMLTGPEAGITRDAIAVEWVWHDRPFKLIDTAGLRRKARVGAKIESLSAADTLRAIRFAQVCLLMLDASDGLEKQDLTIARTIIDEGRAIVLVANKWDVVTDRSKAMAGILDRLQTSLPQIRGVGLVTMSARLGNGVDGLLPAVVSAYDTWSIRIPTAQLNRWLGEMLERHPPPLVRGRRLKIRYVTQAKSRPPTFVAFVGGLDDLPESYLRYLISGLRDHFKLSGTPIRLLCRRGRNPYASTSE